MTIGPDDIEKVATLARIRIDNEQRGEVTQRIDEILTMVGQLQAADTNGIEPLANPLDATQRLRPDLVTEDNQRDKFLKLAPATESGLLLVPRVIE